MTAAAAQTRFGLTCLASRAGEVDSTLSHGEWRRNAYAAAPVASTSISIFGGRQGEKPVGTRMLAKSLNRMLPGLDPSANQEGGP